MRLQRVADAEAQKTIEVEQCRRTQRVDIVGVVEGVEDLHLGNELEPVVDMEWTSDAEVEHEKGVVFAEVIAAAVDAVDEAGCRIVKAARSSGAGTEDIVRLRFGRVLLDAERALEAPWQVSQSVGVELVCFVAVRKRVLRGKVVEKGSRSLESLS